MTNSPVMIVEKALDAAALLNYKNFCNADPYRLTDFDGKAVYLQWIEPTRRVIQAYLAALTPSADADCRKAFHAWFESHKNDYTLYGPISFGFQAWEAAWNRPAAAPSADRVTAVAKTIAESDGFSWEADIRERMHDVYITRAEAALAAMPEPEEDERDAILGLFYAAEVAFAHGDDVTHMLRFGEASERLKAWIVGRMGQPTKAPETKEGA